MTGRVISPRRFLRTRREALSLGAAGAMAVILPHAAYANQAGEVKAIAGRAEAILKQQSRELALEAAVFEGDLVRTQPASQLKLALGPRTTLKLGAETGVRIDRYLVDAGGELELLGGAIGFGRTGPPATGDLQIRSAYGLIAVRGTRFLAGPSNGEFGIFVEEGLVVVTAGGHSVSVGAGLGTGIAVPGAKPSDPRAWSDRRVQALAELIG